MIQAAQSNTCRPPPFGQGTIAGAGSLYERPLAIQDNSLDQEHRTAATLLNHYGDGVEEAGCSFVGSKMLRICIKGLLVVISGKIVKVAANYCTNV